MSRICVKVQELRRVYGPDADLETWLRDPNNVYCGRSGRVFVTKNGSRKVFCYPGSAFANPYSLKDYSLEVSLEKYSVHITRKISEGLNLESLRGKNLGCWCVAGSRCHVDILVNLLRKTGIPAAGSVPGGF